ncbi:MAG TPA: ATP-binding cassette domain-containing protein [Firmicutes bacterium]|nr:ATP-binding cassette domain-containing protein [Bacillota bacterium]
MKIEIQNVTKRIKDATVLDGVSLTMQSGTVYGLRGKNGSGKTMLMRAICGLILPTEGTIAIDGEVMGKDISFPRSVGALIETPAFIPGYTGLRNLQILASIQKRADQAQVEEAIRRVGLEPSDKRKYKKYSLGMKQRLGIAAAIMEKPDLIVLDEPINALDEKGVELVRQILHEEKARGALIIVACHDKEELDFLSDEIFVMENGRVVSGQKTAEKEGTSVEEGN